jgi:hypothetical protein
MCWARKGIKTLSQNSVTNEFRSSIVYSKKRVTHAASTTLGLQTTGQKLRKPARIQQNAWWQKVGACRSTERLLRMWLLTCKNLLEDRYIDYHYFPVLDKDFTQRKMVTIYRVGDEDLEGDTLDALPCSVTGMSFYHGFYIFMY